MLTFEVENDSLILFYNNEQIFKFFKDTDDFQIWSPGVYCTYRELDYIINKVDFNYRSEYLWKTKFKPTGATNDNPSKDSVCRFSDMESFIYKMVNSTEVKNDEIVSNLIRELYSFIFENKSQGIFKMIEDPIYAQAKKLILENNNNNKKLLKIISELSSDNSKSKLEEVSEKVAEINKILS